MGDDNEHNEQKIDNKLEGLLADEMEQKIDDPDEVKPRDRGRPFSIAQFKIWRKGLMANLNSVLQTFQRDAIAAQARVNLAWNGMNAVIRALHNKGLVTDNDLREAGVQLMKEARQNIERAKTAAETKTPLVGVTRVPLEVIRDDINQSISNEEKEM